MSRPLPLAIPRFLVFATACAAVALPACSDDGWLGAAWRPCTADTDCPSPWVCTDGYCGLVRDDADAADTATGPDVGVDTGGGGDVGGGDVEGGDTGVDSSEDDPLWAEFGTRGSITGLVNSQAQCDLRSVRTDDVARSELPDIGSPPWGTAPIPDETGFCGNAAETLGWRLLNCERISRDLDPLRCDLRLTWTAREHSANMRDTGFFDHVDPDGNSPWDRMGDNGITGWTLVGENITTYPTAESAHLSWMESEGHRENILTPGFAWMGQGEASGRSDVYTTQLFARYSTDR